MAARETSTTRSRTKKSATKTRTKKRRSKKKARPHRARPAGKVNLDALNPNQRAAVCCVDGPLLVLAGAGSGKTRVITHRIAYMIEQGIAPESIVALSFTNKAAGEMRERLEHMVGTDTANSLVMGTFHSLGVRMMRAKPKQFRVPARYSILDQGDVFGLVRALLREEGVQGYGSGSDRRFDPGAIVQRISLWKNEFITPEEARSPRYHETTYDEVASMIYGPYEDRLSSLGAVDFDDLVCRVGQTLRDDDKARAYWQSRFHYLLVDEYQDTNRAQFEVLRLIAGDRENLCVVGDDDQAIYGWRGAKVANILGFDVYFPKARVIKLEENYRSRAPILEGANALIANNRGRHDKVLIPQRGPGEPVTEVVADDGAQESAWVGRKIFTLMREQAIPGHDIAVLYRSARHGRIIEERLQEHGLPYRVLGGQAFYDKKQVKDALAYLKTLLTPRDELAVRRALDVPSRGVGRKTMERLSEYVEQHNLTLMQAVHRFARPGHDTGPLPARTVAGLRSFSGLVREAQRRYRTTDSAAEALKGMLDAVSMRDHVVRETGSEEAASHRWAEVERLLESVRRFEKRAREKAAATKKGGAARPRWSEFFASMALDGSQNDKDENAENSARGHGQVTLATMHSCKGLEWPIVFVICCEEGIVPHRRVDAPRISDAIAGDVEEERRLFYVAMTRARDRLLMTRANHRIERGRQVECLPSRFLAELPKTVRVYEIGKEELMSGDAVQSMADAFLAKLAAGMPDATGTEPGGPGGPGGANARTRR